MYSDLCMHYYAQVCVFMTHALSIGIKVAMFYEDEEKFPLHGHYKYILIWYEVNFITWFVLSRFLNNQTFASQREATTTLHQRHVSLHGYYLFVGHQSTLMVLSTSENAVLNRLLKASSCGIAYEDTSIFHELLLYTLCTATMPGSPRCCETLSQLWQLILTALTT